MQAVLILFQDLSSLKVNFSKSMLVGVNVTGSWLAEAALILNCKVGYIPFMYPGLPIGGNARRLNVWDPLIKRINTRLPGWSSRYLSLGGPAGSVEVCPVIVACLCSFFFQSSVRYRILYRIYF